jgi:hypothetical protein
LTSPDVLGEAGCPWRSASSAALSDASSGLSGEHRVVRAGELGVAITDQESEPVDLPVEVDKQIR